MYDEGANEEFEIGINGPNIPPRDSVVKQAIDDYWSAKKRFCHFYKVSVMTMIPKSWIE